MATTRPTQNAMETFMRITGQSESVARRRLEECGGKLDEAINAHFGEVERNSTSTMPAVSPQYDFMERSNQLQTGQRGVLPLLSAARSFKPSLLLDPNYRRNLVNQISSSAFNSHQALFSHPGDFHSGSQQPQYQGLRPNIEGLTGTSLSQGPQTHGDVSRGDESQLHRDNMEREMIQLAIEASKLEASSGTGLPQRQLNLEDDEFSRAISLSLKTAEEENAKRERTVKGQKDKLALNSGRKAKETNSSRGKPESSSLQERTGDVQEHALWDVISSKELEESLLLEAAIFGEIPEGNLFQDAIQLPSGPDKRDDGVNASLLANWEKEIGASVEAETSWSAVGESKNKKPEREELEKLLAAKEASLPKEPSVDDENAVTLMVRMPDGSRSGRCFLKSDKLQFLFDFIDVGRAVKPGTYMVVRPYPRRAFCVGDSSLSLGELGLTSKQEVLFLELV